MTLSEAQGIAGAYLSEAGPDMAEEEYAAFKLIRSAVDNRGASDTEVAQLRADLFHTTRCEVEAREERDLWRGRAERAEADLSTAQRQTRVLERLRMLNPILVQAAEDVDRKAALKQKET